MGTWIGYGCWFLGLISSPLQWLRTSWSSEGVPAYGHRNLNLKTLKLWDTQWLKRFRPFLLAFQIPTDVTRVLSEAGMHFLRDWRLSRNLYLQNPQDHCNIFMEYVWHLWDIQRYSPIGIFWKTDMSEKKELQHDNRYSMIEYILDHLGISWESLEVCGLGPGRACLPMPRLWGHRGPLLPHLPVGGLRQLGERHLPRCQGLKQDAMVEFTWWHVGV